MKVGSYGGIDVGAIMALATHKSATQFTAKLALQIVTAVPPVNAQPDPYVQQVYAEQGKGSSLNISV